VDVPADDLEPARWLRTVSRAFSILQTVSPVDAHLAAAGEIASQVEVAKISENRREISG
jgi:hypothetical protein